MNENEKIPPTDDDREALARIIEDGFEKPDEHRVTADAILAAGFHRSEVPEPSADDSMSHYTDPTDPFWQSKPEPQGEPSDAQVLAALDAFFQGQSTSLSEFGSVSVAGMRAALRAAGGVR